METPRLETERLILRPFAWGDVEAVFTGWETDPEVARYMFWCSHNDIARTREWMKFEQSKLSADDWYRWAITDKESGAVLGTGLIYWEEAFQQFEIGYNFSRTHWGKGYATEAMRSILDFAAHVLGITTLLGRYALENPASGRVMQKLGFVPVEEIPYEANEGMNSYCGMLCKLEFPHYSDAAATGGSSVPVTN